jgi:hypothetical protein
MSDVVDVSVQDDLGALYFWIKCSSERALPAVLERQPTTDMQQTYGLLP